MSHNLLQLESLLRACARGSKGRAQAVAAIRAQLKLQGDSVGDDDSLFAAAVRRWIDQKAASVTSVRFLLLVITCGWERLLVQFLLQHNASDAADDMLTLLSACEQLSEPSVGTLVHPVLDGLLAVTASFALAYLGGSTGDDDTDSFLHLKLLNRVKCCPGCSRSRFPLAQSILSGQDKRQQPSDEDGRWTRFMGLSRDLDARRFDTKSGRALSSAVAEVAEQQQRVLTLARLSLEEKSDFIDDADQVTSLIMVMEKMQEVVTQALRIAISLCGEDSVCSRCANETEFDGHLKAWTPANGDGIDEISLIADDAALESFLMRKTDSVDAESAHNTSPPKLLKSNGSKRIFSAPESEATSFKKLLDALNTQAIQSVSDLGDLVQNTQDELLSTIAGLDVLGIQISVLLSAQLRSKRSVFDLDGSIGGSLKRQVLREFNSLTDGADKDRSVRTLLVLAGFCPSLVLREIVSRATDAPQHIQTYARTLELCPILLEWTNEDEEPECPVLTRELQSSLRELVSAESLFKMQQTHLLEFLCALARLSESVSTDKEDTAAAIGVQTLVREVILPVYESIGLQQDSNESATTDTAMCAASAQASNYFRFVREFVRCAVSETRWRSTTSGVQSTKKLLIMLVSTYQRNCEFLTNPSVELQNTLLLTIKDLLEFIVPLQQAVVSDIVKTSVGDATETLDEPVLVLIAHVVPDIYDWAVERNEFVTLCRLSQDFEDRYTIEKTALVLDQASRVIRLLLWRLLWSSASPSDTSTASEARNQSFFSAARAWRLLEVLAHGTVSDAVSEETGRVCAGNTLVQKELALLMLKCRTSLFASLSDGVLPKLVRILEQSSSSATQVELKPPEPLLAPQLDPKISEAAHLAALECELPMSHAIMRFVCRSWSLLVLSSEQSEDGALESDAVLQMARHLLVSCDRAVSASKSSLVGLLHCFQWVCFVLCALDSESRMRDLESCGSIKGQLNVTLIRLLYLLSQTRLAKEDEASFSQHFVASWMAQLPADSFEQARNSVSSARS